MLEKSIEKKCVKYAKEKGYLSFKLANYSMGNNHLPDRMFIGYKHIIFVEFKKVAGRVSLGQQEMFKLFETKGFKVLIIDNFKDFKNIFDNYC